MSTEGTIRRFALAPCINSQIKAFRTAFPTRSAQTVRPMAWPNLDDTCACVACAHGLWQNKFNDVALSLMVTVSTASGLQVARLGNGCSLGVFPAALLFYTQSSRLLRHSSHLLAPNAPPVVLYAVSAC